MWNSLIFTELQADNSSATSYLQEWKFANRQTHFPLYLQIQFLVKLQFFNLCQAMMQWKMIADFLFSCALMLNKMFRSFFVLVMDFKSAFSHFRKN